MKFLFLVQGEGNGHLTQAVSLFQMLRAEGHEVVAALIGSSAGNRKPDFFCRSVTCPVYTYKSAGLSYSRSGKLGPGATLAGLVRAVPDISASLRYIDSVVKSTEPDLIVNFYEICGGLYNFFFRNAIPVSCIAHQYLFLHPDFRFPGRKILQRCALTLLSRVTAWGARDVYALSFTDSYAPGSRVRVVPPLLRREVTEGLASRGDHVLVYLTQPLLRRQIEKWHRRNPTVKLHCFCNNPYQKTGFVADDTLTFHPTDTRTFIELLRTCRALVTTAGFESVCEAMLLGKPVMMVPVPNHFEQECNALDASLNQIGTVSKNFDLDRLFEYLPRHESRAAIAREWLDQAPRLLLSSLTSSIAAGQAEKLPAGV
ncbi:MAG: hypothetical protein ABS46_06830 [Cytophagaceae bacterium SCN 52-12]|nr:MAG: hypothetical protein ABS46_06830 [Cytophagaceae bacterium SCN 52-12]